MIKIDKEFTHNLNESLSCTNWYAWTYNFLYHHCYQMKKALLGNVMVNHSSFIFTHFSRSSQYFLSYSSNYIKKKKKLKKFHFCIFSVFPRSWRTSSLSHQSAVMWLSRLQYVFLSDLNGQGFQQFWEKVAYPL
jgi:hypothetical protein